VQRLDLRPLLVAAGSLLVAASLFVDWFEPDLTAWDAFEIVDVLLAAAALAGIWAAWRSYQAGRALDERRLLALALVVVVLVAAQVIDPPPAADGESREPGAWIGLAGALVYALGAVLTAVRLSLAITFESRDGQPRQPLRPQARTRKAASPPPPAPEARVGREDEPTTPLPPDAGR
jgi:hypothetical protein